MPVVLPNALLAGQPPARVGTPPQSCGELKTYRLLGASTRQPSGELCKGQAAHLASPVLIRFVFDVESVDDELEGAPIDRLRALRASGLRRPLEIEHNGPRWRAWSTPAATTRC